jgi:hypothetical protein
MPTPCLLLVFPACLYIETKHFHATRIAVGDTLVANNRQVLDKQAAFTDERQSPTAKAISAFPQDLANQSIWQIDPQL